MVAKNKDPRAGYYVRQSTGYKAFLPKPLPPEPPIAFDGEFMALLSKADLALGRLDGSTETLPNPDMFVFMYVRKEAVLSSQIEGTQASLLDVLEFEAQALEDGRPGDVQEVVNYVAAMNYGLDRLHKLPLSLRLIREIHQRLLKDVRGGERTPGEFRRSQNWIGSSGGTLSTATYVPPPPHEMLEAIGALEKFLHQSPPMPDLIKIGLIHSQFETIHPFLDGNGRVGRLLIAFLLCERKILHRPLLYLSYYFKKRRTEYYDRLQAVRDHGDWEGWLKFFLRGVHEVAEEGTDTARKILRLREDHRRLIQERMRVSAGKALSILESLYAGPIISVQRAASVGGVTFPSANSILQEFVSLGLLEETTGRKRNRRFSYAPYLALFQDDAS
jgi:Fic family protein